MEDSYKSILIENKTDDTTVTLIVYHSRNLLSWLSQSSKIISPGKNYFHCSDTYFKYELRGHTEKTRRKVIHETTTWKKDVVLRVTGCRDSIRVEKNDLSKDPDTKQICIKRHNIMEEISTASGRNLYEILQLSMKDVRSEKDTEKQNQMIKKAYHRQLLKWHPDKNPDSGDAEMCREIVFAYSILIDPESRATYNNETDYNNGWLSKSRWKAIFNPECFTKEQIKNYWKRLGLLILSSGLGIGTFCVSFVFSPLAVVTSAFLAGSIQAAFKTVELKSIREGCSVKKAAAAFAVGAVGGALIGGFGFGVTAAISNATMTTTAKCLEVTWLEILRDAMVKGAIGASAGLVGRAIAKLVVKNAGKGSTSSSASADDLAVDTGAMKKAAPSFTAGIETTREPLFQYGGKMFAKKAGEQATGHVLQSAETFAEERLEKSVENRPVSEHAKNALGNAVPRIGKVAVEGERQVLNCIKNDQNGESMTDVFIKNNPVDETCFQGLKSAEGDEETAYTPSLEAAYEDDCVDDLKNGRIRYVSKGWWLSKMIIKYTIPGSAERIEKVKANNAIEIPENARKIEVRFQVNRGIWCDVKKYDRFKKMWFQPTEPHIFHYELPSERTFTLAGPLYYEAVMKITGNYGDMAEM